MTESDTSLVSDYSGSANMRIGIDPAGGTNPYSPGIVWSEYKQPFDVYQQFSVQAQAQGDLVTVFTFSAPSVNPSSPDFGFKHTDMYWDDASLTVVGAGAPPPADGDSGDSPPITVPPYVPGPTSTPDAEGIIYAEVHAGDSLWAISARAGLALDELLEFNDISRDHVIRVGDLLITGFGNPESQEAENGGDFGEAELAALTALDGVEATSTPPPLPTLSEPEVEVEHVAGGSICLKAFDDVDKDTIHDENEPLRSAVAITISDGEQVVSNYITDGESEPFCIEGLSDGNYRVTRSSLPHESLTTPGDYTVAVIDGVSVEVEFGSYLSENVLVSSASAAGTSGGISDNPNASEEGTLADEPDDGLSGLAIVGIVIAVLLLAGIVILVLSNRRTETGQ
jgi:hypothetical protein